MVTVDIKKGPLVKGIILFAWPLVLSGIFQLLFNAVDTMMVGRLLGREYLAAIGATAPIIAFFSNGLMAFAQGISVLVSRGVSKKDEQSYKEITSIVLVFSLFLGMVVGLAAIAITPWILQLIGTPEDIVELSVLYLRIYLAGMPFFLFYNFGAAVIRSLGNSVVSLIYVAVSGACNVVLNILFIKLGMGVAGVAIATIMSQLLSAVLVAGYIRNNDIACKIAWKKMPEILREVFRLGFPAALQTMLLSLSNIIIQEEVNRFGTTVLAGQTVYMSLNGFLLAAINAITQTAIVFVGQNDAINDKKRVKLSALYCSFVSCILGSGLGLLMYIFGDVVCIPYTDAPEVVDIVKTLLPIVAVPYGICGIMEVLAGAVRGTGKAVSPTVMHLLGVGVFRVLWLKLVLPHCNTLEMLFACYPLSWIVTSVLQLILLYAVIKRKHWYASGTLGSGPNVPIVDNLDTGECHGGAIWTTTKKNKGLCASLRKNRDF